MILYSSQARRTQCLAICFPITNFYLSLFDLKAFSHPVFIFRQNLVPKHSSQAPALLACWPLPLSLSTSHHPLQSHWPFAFSVAASSPAFELSPRCSSPALPTPFALTHLQNLSLYHHFSRRLSLTLSFLAPAGEHSTHYAWSKLRVGCSHRLSLGTLDRRPGRMPNSLQFYH